MEGKLKLLMMAALTLLVALTSHAFPATFKDPINPAKPVVWVKSNGYRNVTVGIRDDLLEGDCEMFVDGLKAVTREASRLLHQVTHGTLYFEEVTILLPSTWACTSVPPKPSVPMTWREAHIIVGPTHPVFRDAPWTQQPRGCGQEGDFIYLTETWLKSYQQHADENSAKELVAQWARFRWGVFGEEGYLGDLVHPPSYLLNASSQSRNPTLCHNGDLQGDFSGSCEKEDSANCSFSINTAASSNVTSSLMALPSLLSVLEFCDEDTHNAAVPTKHNLMCGGSSVWQVISRHPDLSGRKEWLGDVEPTFRVQRAEDNTQPSHVDMVLVLQYTSTMSQTLSRWKFLRDAVRKFLLVEAPKGTKIGLVTLTDSAATLAGLTTLTDAASRLSLANKVPENPPTISATKNLEAGIIEAVNILDGNGLVVLVVENLSNHTSEISENLVAAAGNTSVWAVLYPHLPSVSTSLYQDLVDSTNGSLLTVVNPYGPMYQSVDDLVALNNQLRTILSATLEPHSVWMKKDEALCLASCSLTLQVDDEINYRSEVILELSFLFFDAAGLKSIEMKAPDGTVLTPSAVDSKYETIRHHFYTQAQVQQTGNYTVVIERLTYVDGVMVSLLVMPRPPVLPVVWASEPLQELHQSNSSVPTLFVQLWQGECYLVKAAVTATISFSGANVTLMLRDDGTRGDVTGGDGIYSGVIIGVDGQAEVNIVAHGNGGAALLVGSYSSLTLSTSDKTLKSSSQVCCGSQIDLSQVKTEAAGSFYLSSSVEATFLDQPAGDLPPGRITDLSVQYSADSLSLHFTASGEDYYNGEEASSPSSENKLGIFLGSVFGGLLFLALAGISAEYIYSRVSSKIRKRRS
ncbi:calcium-activated chloride channel regulator 1-like isoform X2 [Scylla paramamosain]|uniref:calcium-activated chloride channel regulator 1-like isoform X2 n=1 Tax=Scylla paramamosain TaxID=85552 RepID=UPI0030828C9D